jgi:hypothetical protein
MIWLLGPIGRWVLVSVGVMGLLLGARFYFVHEGIEEGKRQAAVTTAQDDAARTKVERDQLLATLSENTKVISAATQRYEAAAARERQVISLIQGIQTQRDVGRAQVQQMTDSNLHPYITEKLGVRPGNDLAGGYYPAEERKIAECVTDYPLCKKQNDEYVKQTDELREQTSALNDRMDGLTKQVAALQGYSATLEGHYALLYNQLGVKKRGPQCLWIWKCAPSKITAPSPAELKVAIVGGLTSDKPAK